MMRARVNLITADPDRMADAIGYIKTSVRPVGFHNFVMVSDLQR